MTVPQPESVFITKDEFLAEIDQRKPCRHCVSEPAIHVDPYGTWSSWDVVLLHDRGCPGIDEERQASSRLRLVRDHDLGEIK